MGIYLNLNDIIDINYFNNIVNNNKKIKIDGGGMIRWLIYKVESFFLSFNNVKPSFKK